MIPGVMVEFLARASVAIAATRDRELRSNLHAVSGWKVEDDGRTVLMLVPGQSLGGLVEALEDNGRIAMAAEVIGPHETYQFKGAYVSRRPVEEADRVLFEDCRMRFVRAIQHHYGMDAFAPDALTASVREPVLAVRFVVEEIYLQTPGPGAGERLFPVRR